MSVCAANVDNYSILTFSGNRPQESKGSLIRVAATDDLTTSRWGMKIKHAEEKTVCLTVMSSAKAFVGKYDLYVETRITSDAEDSGDQLEFRYKHDEEMIVLFNAWCKGILGSPIYLSIYLSIYLFIYL